jgi:hypothetical protein
MKTCCACKYSIDELYDECPYCGCEVFEGDNRIPLFMWGIVGLALWLAAFVALSRFFPGT